MEMVKKEYGTKDGEVPDDKNPFILRKHKDKKAPTKSTGPKVTHHEDLIEDGEEDIHGGGFLPEGMNVDIPPPSSLEIQHETGLEIADKKQIHGNGATKPRSLRSTLPTRDDDDEVSDDITSSTIVKVAPQGRNRRFESYKFDDNAEVQEEVEAAHDTHSDIEKAAQVKKRKRPPRSSTGTTSSYFKKR
jgi:hypothetical protein